MTDFPDEMIQKARGRTGKLVLPEGNDERVVEAAKRLVREDIVDEVFLPGADPAAQGEGIRVPDPGSHPDRDELAHRLANRDADLTLAEAEQLIKDPLYFGAGMVLLNKVQGMVAGAANPTANVLRAALKMIGTRPDSSVVSSSFVMEIPDRTFGVDGRLLFTDPAVLPSPDEEELTEMASDASRLFRTLLGAEDPRVAFLSFSTRGSASHPMVDKMVRASRLFAERHPDILSDGELQADAALVPAVADRKAPESPVAGRANVLVFPNLDAANIGYKLVQRLGGAGAYGPFLQGLNGAVNDLSRGCSIDDIVTVGAVTLLQGTD